MQDAPLPERARRRLSLAFAAIRPTSSTEAADTSASLDVLFDKLVAQLRKYREKVSDKHQREAREERQYG